MHAEYAVLDFDAEANALALAQFSDAEKVGGSEVKIDGEIGREFGIDWFADDGVPNHPSGTASDSGAHGFVIGHPGAAGTAGDATATIKTDTGSPTLVVCDVLSFAGHAQSYVVTAGATLDGTGGAVSVSLSLGATVADAAAVDVRASHIVNPAFHRDAFALAMRPLTAGTADLSLGNRILSMTDAQTGLSLRLEDLWNGSSAGLPCGQIFRNIVKFS